MSRKRLRRHRHESPALPTGRVSPNVPCTVPSSVTLRFALRRPWPSSLRMPRGANPRKHLRRDRHEPAASPPNVPLTNPQSVTRRFALRRPWPSSLRMRTTARPASRLSALTGRVSPAAQTPSPTSPPRRPLQTARTRLAGLRHACASHRLRLPHRSVHRSVVGHPALCTSSTPALVRRIQKVASSMHTRADQSHERDPPPIGNVNKTRPGPARRIHANPP